ncbi:hypothetical protein CYLTODRAFT_423715 [Cylindrobasidium torrendii FP15055 ss-10]|uniref:Nucleolar protein 16 n=1 Tax=Cylindrobasidium torrendii FP15055 ss-10 TaxID=1314674 RepID=A0A0D7B6A5_9AGAR|nr:hypothetical protein CYLTODRAFT_423715 [Cylindrobasidium torrendii FP15055 ss-10]
MANPRQRRKSRSGSHRAVSHSKNAKRNLKKTPPIRAPLVLQKAWDPTKTVTQNYAALGLVHDLNPSASGGAEIINVDVHEEPAAPQPSSSTIETAIPQGKGRIIRDEAGNVLRIEMAEAHEEQPEEDMDVMREPDLETRDVDKWVTDLGITGARPAGKDGELVKELEKIAVRTDKAGTTLSASLTGVGPRHTSHGEKGYLVRLVDKYGKDIEKMARDRRLNPDQRTTGELRKALKRAGL